MRPQPTDADVTKTMTLEAFADTIIPGEKRGPGDAAVAGAASGPGAVAAGAVELLQTPATGLTEDLDVLVRDLNEHARRYAAERELPPGGELSPDGELPPFVALSFDDRAALVAALTAPGHPEKEVWVLLAVFSTMAFDSAAHLHTADAVAAGHPGLAAIGIGAPDSDGLWRFPDFSYRRQLAQLHPSTNASGNLE